jgi:hypothetical protein
MSLTIHTYACGHASIIDTGNTYNLTYTVTSGPMFKEVRIQPSGSAQINIHVHAIMCDACLESVRVDGSGAMNGVSPEQ